MVPAELLEYYFGMIDQVKVQQVDGELPFLCAYSFPGVVHTLGAAGWPQLKPIFDHLSQHMHVSSYIAAPTCRRAGVFRGQGRTKL